MASLEINVRTNIRDMERNLTDLARRQIPRATNRTLNRVGARASKAAIADVASQAGTTQKAIRRGGFWVNLRSRARTLVYTIKVRYGAIPLKAFSARQTKRGVTASAWGKRELYDGAFKVESLGGNVFTRKSKDRLPIKKLWGPQPSRLVLSPETERTITGVLDRDFAREFLNNLRYYYDRAAKR